jgi:hypothetical protein
MPLNLQLLPLLPADALPVEPDTDRPYKFTVISTTPGVKPLTVGVVGELGMLWGGGGCCWGGGGWEEGRGGH